MFILLINSRQRGEGQRLHCLAGFEAQALSSISSLQWRAHEKLEENMIAWTGSCSKHQVADPPGKISAATAEWLSYIDH